MPDLAENLLQVIADPQLVDARLLGEIEEALARHEASENDILDLLIAASESLAEAGRFDLAITILDAYLTAGDSNTEASQFRLVLMNMRAIHSGARGDIDAAIAGWTTLLESRDTAGTVDVERSVHNALATLFRRIGDEESAELHDSLALAIPNESTAISKPIDARSSTIGEDEARLRSRSSGSPPPNHEVIGVFFATDRERSGVSLPTRFYGGKRRESGVEYGVAEVSVPLEGSAALSPRIWRGEFSSDPDVHVILRRIRPIGVGAPARTQFASDIAEALDGSKGREALVFVHGFNTSFNSGVARCAQLTKSLEISGVPVTFSWSSRGTIQSYLSDQDKIGFTAELALADLIRLLTEQCKANAVHLIAHSMGNRLAIGALKQLQAEQNGRNTPWIGQFIAASPDVERDNFKAHIEYGSRVMRRTTVYASKNDLALRVSSIVNGSSRAGQPGGPPIEGADVVDTSVAGALGIKHDDYAGPALKDIQALIWHDLPPPHRPWIGGKTSPSEIWPLLQPDQTEELWLEFIHALRIVRVERLYGADALGANFREALASSSHLRDCVERVRKFSAAGQTPP